MDSSLPPSLLSQFNSPSSLFLLAASGAKLNSKKLRKGDVAEAGLGDDADSDISGSSSAAEPRKNTRARPKRCCAPPLLPRAPTVAAVHRRRRRRAHRWYRRPHRRCRNEVPM